jgi:protein-tyrosine phosphatase
MLRVLALSLVLVLVVGNATIFTAMMWARADQPGHGNLDLAGVANLEVVDDMLWRGAAPSTKGLEALAANGVNTVIDLRAESVSAQEVQTLERLGVRLVRIPMRDGQAPNAGQVSAFMKAVDSGRGRVFVHCGAGVGRTGTMAAAYLVRSGNATASEALVRNLAVGPPSLEQLAYVDGMGDGSFARPPAAVTAFSRFLDAPRRLMSRLGI